MKRRRLLVYTEQDTATGTWLIDCPELWIYGAIAGGNLRQAVETVLGPVPDNTELEIRDMSGEYPVEYDGEERP